MKTIKKTKIILITFILFSLIINIVSYASNTYEVKMYSSKAKILAGETVNISVRLENIELENGIAAFSTLLLYDKDIFEEPIITSAKNWAKPIVVENLIQSTTETIQPTNDNQEIMTLSFKIKENAKLGETEIKLSQFDVSDGENTISNDGAEMTFDIQNTKTEITNVLIDSGWFNARNVIVSLIIGMVTMIIIVILTIYYLERRNKIEKANMIYEEIKGITDDKEQKAKEESNSKDEK